MKRTNICWRRTCRAFARNFFLSCVIFGRRSVWIELTFWVVRMSWVTCRQRHSCAVSSPWTKTASKKLNSSLCESLWPARSGAHVCSEDSSSMIRSQAHVGLSGETKSVGVDSSHRTEMWGAPKFTRALFLFWFKRREMSAKWFRTESYRSCGSWITFAALRFLLPIDSCVTFGESC